MKIKTHLKLAKLSLMKCNHKEFDKFSLPFFYLGVICADMSWLSKTRPHYASRSLPYIETKIDKLSFKQFSRYRSMQMGIVVHYLCDFCCVAHQGHSAGNLKSHIEYEKALAAHFKKIFPTLKKQYEEVYLPDTFKDQSLSDFKTFLHDHLHTYHEGKRSLHWDIEMATLLNVRFCHMLLG